MDGKGLKQRDSLSTALFNAMLEVILREHGIPTGSIIYNNESQEYDLHINEFKKIHWKREMERRKIVWI